MEVVGQNKDEQVLNFNIPDTENNVAYENQDVEAVVMTEGSPTDAQLDFNQRGIFLILFYSIIFSFVVTCMQALAIAPLKQHSVCMIGCFNCVGDAAGPSSDSSWSMDCSTILRVKCIYISSAILAAKSLFFHKVRSCALFLLLLLTELCAL